MAKEMYPTNNLYEKYDGYEFDSKFSSAVPDVTLQITLEHMNYAINLCESWGTALDIGGGNGRYLTALSTRFKNNILVEVSDEPEHALIKEKYSNISICNQLIEDYQASTTADFILLADIYEHIRDIAPFVQQVAGLQRKGGVVYIMTPNPVVCGPANESGLHHTLHTNGHIRHYPQREIITLMEEQGYELVFSLYEEGTYRQKAKRIIFALSRRDQAWQKKVAYALIRPFVLIVTNVVLQYLGKKTYREEMQNAHNQFSGLTQDLAFKKKV